MVARCRSALLALPFVLILAGCGGGGEATDEAVADPAPVADPAQDDEGAGDDVDGSGDGASVDDEGQPSGGTLTVRDVRDLTPGDCIVLPDGAEVSELQVTPCDQPHDGEVFGILFLEEPANAPYPGPEAVEVAGNDACIAGPFEPYVGRAYATSEIYVRAFLPTEASWREGDRTVICFGVLETGQLTESFAGSGR
jgi:hypothetical protein